MEVRLHLGAHRTGTTRLQREMRRRGDELAGLGIAAHGPRSLRVEGTALFRWQSAVPALRMLRSEPVARLAAALEAARAAHARRLVVSEENYAGGIGQMLADGRLYPKVGARLAVLRPALGAGPLTVLFAVRGYAGFHASAYAHRTRRVPMAPFEGLKPGLLALPRRWPAVVADIAAALPGAELLVWAFEDEGSHGGPAMRLLTGEPDLPDHAEALPQALAAPKAPAVAALNAMRTGAGLTHAARLEVVKRFAGPEHAAFDPWTEAERARLDAAYAADLEALRKGGPARMIDLGPARALGPEVADA